MSVKELYEALKVLCEDVGLRKNMANNGRQMAEQIFEMNKINQSYLALYQN